jgi:acyl-CoA synthetase (AMP-forming)/AMP-acid ligase II
MNILATENNVVTFLARAADRVPDRPALIAPGPRGDDRFVTFGRLWKEVDRTSVGLSHAGLHAGERAIVMVPMSIELYVILLAIIKIGAVAVFVDPWLRRRQIASFAAFAQPRAFVGVPRSHILRWLDRRLLTIPLTVTTGRRWWRIPAGRTLSELRAPAGDGKIQPVSPDGTALITFTTGSSGTPKGANRTHRFLTAQHEVLSREFPHQDDDVDMAMFPVFALNNLAGGISTVIPKIDFRRVVDLVPEIVSQQISTHGVTTCTASPTFFDCLAKHSGRNEVPFPAPRRILTGGAPVSDRQLRNWQHLWPRTEIVVVYGSTEAEPVAHMSAGERLAAGDGTPAAAPGYCVGKPSSSVRAKVIRISRERIDLAADGWTDWEVPQGEVGELVVMGDHVCRDYYRNPEATATEKIRDPSGAVWHRMGDTGYFDSDGRFWLVGRVHSTICRGGELIHPQLVEQTVRADDDRISQSAALGLPDAELGERLAVVARVAEEDQQDAVRQTIEDRLVAAGVPFDHIIVTRNPLPVDPRHNAKIDYSRLREKLGNPRS